MNRWTSALIQVCCSGRLLGAIVLFDFAYACCLQDDSLASGGAIAKKQRCVDIGFLQSLLSLDPRLPKTAAVKTSKGVRCSAVRLPIVTAQTGLV
jgi:hypothetical protein